MSLTQEQLKELAHYDPGTGVWTCLVKSSYRKPGDILGGKLNSHGYHRVGVGKRRYYAHKLAFLYMTGEIPKEIDHKDGNRTNNKWDNLRVATRQQNNFNRGKTKNRPEPLPKGVTRCQNKRGKTTRYFARIYLNNKPTHLGCFSTPEEASDAYIKAAKELYGDFAKHENGSNLPSQDEFHAPAGQGP